MSRLITWIVSFIILMAGIVFSCPNTLGKSGYDVKGYWCLRFMSYLFYFDFLLLPINHGNLSCQKRI